MEEVTDSAETRLAWQELLPAAMKDHRVAAQLAREANGRGEHMLALSLAEGALRRLSLVADPREALPLRKQMALALARSGSPDEAMEVLRDSAVAIPADAETLGLMGRLHKDSADSAPNADEAARHRQKALGFYARGFEVEQSAYCGINAAVLSVLTGDMPVARKMATQVLQLQPEPDRLWALATAAMAHMICGEREMARETFGSADRAGSRRRSDLATVRREARRLAAVLEGDAGTYDTCFRPAAVAFFRGSGAQLGDRGQVRLVRWLEENDVVCAWAAAASGEEAEFLEKVALLGVETCAVLPEAAPREHFRKSAGRAALVDFLAESLEGCPGADELARRVALARAAALAGSWDVPLVAISSDVRPGYWADLDCRQLSLRDGPAHASAPETRDGRMSAVLCVKRASSNAELPPGAPDLREIWQNHPARWERANKAFRGCYFFHWPSMGEAGQAALDLQRMLQPDGADSSHAFILHASTQATADDRLDGWVRRIGAGRIHATGRFADLAALESSRSFGLCYVGTIDCQAEPLGIRLYHLQGRGRNGKNAP